MSDNLITRKTQIYDWIDIINKAVSDVKYSVNNISVHNNTLSVSFNNGKLVDYTMVYPATDSIIGGVIIGDNITNNNGVIGITAHNVISALGYKPLDENDRYELPIADSEILGGVKLSNAVSISNGEITGVLDSDTTGGVAVTPTGLKYVYELAESAKQRSNSALVLSLPSSVGSEFNPVYFDETGVPVKTTYTLKSNVPADAKFTDTIYTLPQATNESLGGVIVLDDLSIVDTLEDNSYTVAPKIINEIKLSTDRNTDIIDKTISIIDDNITFTVDNGHFRGNLLVDGTINATIDGVAKTAETLETPRRFLFAGDVIGYGDFDGSSDVSIALSVVDDSHDHVIDNIDGLYTALSEKADLYSPQFTGNPSAPTPKKGSNNTQLATTEFVSEELHDVVRSDIQESTTNNVVVFSDISGRTIKDSGYTISCSVPADAKFTDTIYTLPVSTESSLGGSMLCSKLNSSIEDGCYSLSSSVIEELHDNIFCTSVIEDFNNINESIFNVWSQVSYKIVGTQFRIVAEDIIKLFEDEGLDITQYSLFEPYIVYEDTIIIDSEAVYDENGEELTPAVTHTEKIEVTKYKIRLNEALTLECAYQRWMGEQREKRIKVLEETIMSE